MGRILPRSPEHEAAAVLEPLGDRRQRGQAVPAQVELLERGRAGELVRQRGEAICPEVEQAQAREGREDELNSAQVVRAEVQLPKRRQSVQRLRQLGDSVAV